MVRTRFAPSPTGFLHIGGVRTALYNWLFAKQHDGQFILRIDDTDQNRNQEAALQPILDGFRWLGLDWDEGPEVGGPYAPYYQSQRGDRYQAAVDQLLASGAAYWDYATADDLEQQRDAARERGETFVYNRQFAAETDAERQAFEAEGRAGVVRLKMPREGACEFDDLVAGPQRVQWANEQDSVIQRTDGSFIYHLASVVDDHDLKITHVIRGVEHLSNTPRQIYIAQSLGYEPPQYAHLPYVAEPGSKSKLSKRKIAKYLKNPEFNKLYTMGKEIADRLGLEVTEDSFNPVLVEFYREVGFLPDTLNNYLLMLGWALDGEREQFNREEMLEHFSLERVNSAAASFDPDKLTAFQTRDFVSHDIKKKVALATGFLQRCGWVATPPPCDTAPLVRTILEHAGDRIKVAGDILNYPEFFQQGEPLSFEPKAVKKQFKGEYRTLLGKLAELLPGIEPFDAATIEAALKQFAEAEELKLGKINGPLRVAVTGKSVGIGMYETLEILGSSECVARIDQAMKLDP